MANFLAVVDRDRERREQFLKTVEPLLPPLAGLRTGACRSGDFAALWAVTPQAPVSSEATAHGASLLIGHAFRRSESQRFDAVLLTSWWSPCPDRVPEPLDGYHVGLVYRSSGDLIVGADLLGLFPIYYYAADGVLLVGSSPELFRHHPLFRTSFNPDAFATMLLLMYPLAGETLFRNVRRLDAGHLLIGGVGRAPTELLQYRLPLSDEYVALPFSRQIRLLDEAMEQAVARHVPRGGRCALLLSGGRDSRLLAGYLHRQRHDVVALTLGNASDEFELNFGRAVAKTLGFPHETRAISLDEYPRYADLHARWLHGSGGFDPIMYWGFDAHLRGLPAPVVTGYGGDPIVGGSSFKSTYYAARGPVSFEAFFKEQNRCGFDPGVLSKLLSPALFRDSVEEAVDRVRRVYERSGANEAQRIYAFVLRHRTRLYVGSVVWLASFGAWPVQPFVDQDVLQVVGGMPVSTLAERRAQDALLCSKFPDLAALPLDRNSFDTTPLQPRLRWLLGRYLASRLPWWERRQHRQATSDGDQRLYYSLWNINNRGWKAVRREADRHRHLLADFLDKDRLSELLPLADTTLMAEDMIAGHSGVRSLIGFVLWARDHLSLARPA